MNDEVADVIAQGIDVAVRVGELADSRLLSRRLAPYRLCALASPAYLAEHGTSMHPDDLYQAAWSLALLERHGIPIGFRF